MSSDISPYGNPRFPTPFVGDNANFPISSIHIDRSLRFRQENGEIDSVRSVNFPPLPANSVCGGKKIESNDRADALTEFRQAGRYEI